MSERMFRKGGWANGGCSWPQYPTHYRHGRVGGHDGSGGYGSGGWDHSPNPNTFARSASMPVRGDLASASVDAAADALGDGAAGRGGRR